jgi:hypothetical protein
MKAISRQEVVALREGDIVYVRMEVRKPLGEFGTIQCQIANGARTSHNVLVSPEHIFGRMTGELSGTYATSSLEIVVLDSRPADSDPQPTLGLPLSPVGMMIRTSCRALAWS